MALNVLTFRNPCLQLLKLMLPFTGQEGRLISSQVDPLLWFGCWGQERVQYPNHGKFITKGAYWRVDVKEERCADVELASEMEAQGKNINNNNSILVLVHSPSNNIFPHIGHKLSTKFLLL